MATSEAVTLVQGSKEWRRLRELCTRPVPGQRSALYYLNAKVLGHEDKVPMTPRAHYAMCLFAEGATGIPEIDDARVKMALVPRGFGKSTLITKGLTILRLLQNRDYAVGIANEIKDNAEGFLAMVAMEFQQNTFLQGLFPECIPENFRDTTWKSDEIVINRRSPRPMSPSVLATGVGGTVTGVHMDAWICDDLLSKNAAEAARKGNLGEIEGTNHWISQLPPLLCSPERDPIYFIGTRWWEGDSYDYVRTFWGNDEEPKEYKLTLTLPDGELQTVTFERVGDLAIYKRPAIENGRAIFPERYNLEELERMAQRDPVFYAGQYLLEPSAGGASKFRKEDLKFYEFDGRQIRYRDQLGEIQYQPLSELMTFVSVDPAFSKKSEACRTAIPVVGTNGQQIFLLEDYARHGIGEDDIAEKVIEFYRRYRPRKIFVETIVAQIVIANAIRRVARSYGLPELPLEEIPSHGDAKKLWRIFALEPIFRRGDFYIHRSHQDFLKEYSTFPRAALRDLLDALSFQREEWERIAELGVLGGAQDRNRLQMEQEAIERIRRSMGPN